HLRAERPKLLGSSEHYPADCAYDAALPVADRHPGHDSCHTSHFVGTADLRFAGSRYFVKAGVLNDFGDMFTDSFAGFEAKETTVHGTQVLYDSIRIDDGHRVVGIDEKVLEDFAGKRHGGNKFEQRVVDAARYLDEQCPVFNRNG